ncbi:GAF domain-containing protein [Streptomyces sp. NPDC004111]|uniref:GAF domain-containing protein n=1 Tax=Streptomyces sp. NPDC004111 TaxID=3364690 RepID=UPI0036A85E7F
MRRHNEAAALAAQRAVHARAYAEQRQVDAERMASQIQIKALESPRDQTSFPRLEFLDPYFLAGTPPTTLLDALAGCVAEVLDVPRCDAQQACPANGGLQLVAHRGMSAPFLTYFALVADRSTACGQAAESGCAVWVHDVRTSSLFTDGSRQAVLDAQSRAVLSLPLGQPGGPVLGVLSLHHRSPGLLAHVDTALLGALTRAAGRALQWHASRPPVVQNRRASAPLQQKPPTRTPSELPPPSVTSAVTAKRRPTSPL